VAKVKNARYHLEGQENPKFRHQNAQFREAHSFYRTDISELYSLSPKNTSIILDIMVIWSFLSLKKNDSNYEVVRKMLQKQPISKMCSKLTILGKYSQKLS
jgi:hypothetical protein